MGGDDYLAEFNKPGLSALRGYLASGQAVAFLGAGVSAPLYPLWTGLIGDLVDAAAERMSADEAATCRALARESPEEVVEIIDEARRIRTLALSELPDQDCCTLLTPRQVETRARIDDLHRIEGRLGADDLAEELALSAQEYRQ